MDRETSYESKKKSRRETKKRILEVALDLIRESGHYYVTLDQVADRLHISKVSIYHHWTSKQEILYDLMRIAYRAFNEALEKIAEGDDPPDIKLQRAIENHVHQAVISSINPMLGKNEWNVIKKHQKEIIRLRDSYDTMFYKIIKEGIDKGTFKKINARMLYYTIMGATNYTWLWYSEKGGMSVAEIGSNMSSFLLDGIRTVAPRKKQ